jgi:hypothetical protein
LAACSLVLAGCTEKTNSPNEVSLPDASNSDFDTATLRTGDLRWQYIDVPEGASVTDMNGRGDLLLGYSWLPKGKKTPIDLPNWGLSINDRRQILLQTDQFEVYSNETVSSLGRPCTPSGSDLCFSESMFWKIDDLGDVLAWYSRTPYGGEWIVTVWRASNRRWEPLDSFPEANLGQFDLSASGWVAVNVQTALPSQQAYIYSPTGQRWALRTDGACPGTNADATGSTVDLVNDEGLAHGWIDCAGERFPVRWTLGGR